MSTGNNGSAKRPSRGEIWMYDPNPVRGREQGEVRPGLVISSDIFNHGVRELVVIVPMSRTRRVLELYPYHVELDPDDSGLPHVSVAMCEQLRTISIDRLIGRQPRGWAKLPVMIEIENNLRHLLDL